MNKFLGVSIADKALGNVENSPVSEDSAKVLNDVVRAEPAKVLGDVVTDPVKEQKASTPVPKPVSRPVTSSRPAVAMPKERKYMPGMYRSDKFMRIIKELTYQHAKDENGKIRKTHGTWSNPKNMIVFQKGVETKLTEEDLKLPVIRSLIDRKTIYRLG